MKAEPLLQICWLIANEEAKQLGATTIEPLHFLLGILKVIDPLFPKDIDSLDIPSEDWASMCKSAQSVRNYIEILPDSVKRKRRKLRFKLNSTRTKLPITEKGMLHRSEDLKQAFNEAQKKNTEERLFLRDVVQSLFSLNLITLSDIDGETLPNL